MKYQWLKWQPAKPRCLVTTDIVSVDLRTIYFAFYILGAGVIASVIILFAEKLNHKRYVSVLEIGRARQFLIIS